MLLLLLLLFSIQHCTWLNTCVGTRNYVPFFSLVVTGTCQMLYQSVLGGLYMTLWRGDTAAVPDRYNTVEFMIPALAPPSYVLFSLLTCYDVCAHAVEQD